MFTARRPASPLTAFLKLEHGWENINLRRVQADQEGSRKFKYFVRNDYVITHASGVSGMEGKEHRWWKCGSPLKESVEASPF